MSGQLEVVDKGSPFVFFDLGGGKSATCNPISEPDLAAALVDTISDKTKENALWNLGGPDAGMSMQEQGRILADVLGREEAKVRSSLSRSSGPTSGSTRLPLAVPRW